MLDLWNVPHQEEMVAYIPVHYNEYILMWWMDPLPEVSNTRLHDSIDAMKVAKSHNICQQHMRADLWEDEGQLCFRQYFD